LEAAEAVVDSAAVAVVAGEAVAVVAVAADVEVSSNQ
jgi:hypothetical protein